MDTLSHPKDFTAGLAAYTHLFATKGLQKNYWLNSHELAREFGYKFVVTHTQNKYHEMLILNIKAGFQIIGTKINQETNDLIIMMELRV